MKDLRVRAACGQTKDGSAKKDKTRQEDAIKMNRILSGENSGTGRGRAGKWNRGTGKCTNRARQRRRSRVLLKDMSGLGEDRVLKQAKFEAQER